MLELLNIKIYKCLPSNLTNVSSFHPLEVMGRGTQHLVCEKLNKCGLQYFSVNIQEKTYWPIIRAMPHILT